MKRKSLSALAVLITLLALSRAAISDGVSPPSAGESTASGPAPAAADQGTFIILTYNVAGLPQGISQGQPILNTPKISPRLNDFDLALTQEDFFYAKALKSKTTHRYYAPRSDTGTLGDGLSRFSRFPMSAVNHQAWRTCHGVLWYANDCLTPKGFSYARHTIAPGVEIDVYDLHADAGPDRADQETRAKQMDQMIAFIKDRSAGRAVIVGGDTNLGSRPIDEATFKKLLDGLGLTDACAALDCGKDRLDRIVFRSGEGVTLTPLKYQVERERFSVGGLPLSDHLPVSVTFRWQKG
jgi:endonuclease/exonuclease/phosphatase (EEP) superfamily protein YafD